MKKTFILSLSVLALAGAIAQEKKKETLEGNGKMVTRDVAVSSFETLKASGFYELKLSQDNRETVKIEADENLHEYFTVRNEGNQLVIDMKKTGRKKFQVQIEDEGLCHL